MFEDENRDPFQELVGIGIGTPTHIEGYMRDRTWLEKIAPVGFTLIVNHKPQGVEYFDSTYPRDWRNEYVKQGFMWRDPVIRAAMFSRRFDRRWSGIGHKMESKVFEAAKRYGLNFGVTFARTRGFKKSLLSLAHHEREFTDSEVSQVSAWFDGFLEKVETSFELSEGELAVAKAIALGWSRKRVASLLGVSDGTVNKRLKRARQKMGCRTDNELVFRLAKRL